VIATAAAVVAVVVGLMRYNLQFHNQNGERGHDFRYGGVIPHFGLVNAAARPASASGAFRKGLMVLMLRLAPSF